MYLVEFCFLTDQAAVMGPKAYRDNEKRNDGTLETLFGSLPFSLSPKAAGKCL